jgi:hypothetical protein
MFINGKLSGEIMMSLVISCLHTNGKITRNINKLNIAVFRVNTRHVTYCLFSDSIMCENLFQKRAYLFLMGAIPMCLGTIRIIQYPSNTTNLSIIKLATCFDPMGSISGLHYEPINLYLVNVENRVSS